MLNAKYNFKKKYISYFPTPFWEGTEFTHPVVKLTLTRIPRI